MDLICISFCISHCGILNVSKAVVFFPLAAAFSLRKTPFSQHLQVLAVHFSTSLVRTGYFRYIRLQTKWEVSSEVGEYQNVFFWTSFSTCLEWCFMALTHADKGAKQ